VIRRFELKTTIQAAGTAGGVIRWHSDSQKFELSIRSSNEVDTHFDRDLPAVARHQFDFEDRSEAVADAVFDHGLQIGRGLSGKQVQDIQSLKFDRTVTGKAFTRFVNGQNIAVKIESKDNLVIQTYLHFFIGIERLINCRCPRIATEQDRLAEEKLPM
jgi:hypothetical protein